MPHTSVSVFLPAGQQQEGQYVSSGALVDPRLVALVPPAAVALSDGRTVRVHLRVGDGADRLVRGTVLVSPVDGRIAMVRFAKALSDAVLEKLPASVTSTTDEARAGALLAYLEASRRGTVAIQTTTVTPTAGAGGKPWWCYLVRNGPGC